MESPSCKAQQMCPKIHEKDKYRDMSGTSAIVLGLTRGDRQNCVKEEFSRSMSKTQSQPASLLILLSRAESEVSIM